MTNTEEFTIFVASSFIVQIIIVIASIFFFFVCRFITDEKNTEANKAFHAKYLLWTSLILVIFFTLFSFFIAWIVGTIHINTMNYNLENDNAGNIVILYKEKDVDTVNVLKEKMLDSEYSNIKYLSYDTEEGHSFNKANDLFLKSFSSPSAFYISNEGFLLDLEPLESNTNEFILKQL